MKSLCFSHYAYPKTLTHLLYVLNLFHGFFLPILCTTSDRRIAYASKEFDQAVIRATNQNDIELSSSDMSAIRITDSPPRTPPSRVNKNQPSSRRSPRGKSRIPAQDQVDPIKHSLPRPSSAFSPHELESDTNEHEYVGLLELKKSNLKRSTQSNVDHYTHPPPGSPPKKLKSQNIFEFAKNGNIEGMRKWLNSQSSSSPFRPSADTLFKDKPKRIPVRNNKGTSRKISSDSLSSSELFKLVDATDDEDQHGSQRVFYQELDEPLDMKQVLGTSPIQGWSPTIPTMRNSIDQFDPDGCSPLMIASKYGHLNLVELLVEYGATINTHSRRNQFHSRSFSNSEHLLGTSLPESVIDFGEEECRKYPPVLLASLSGHVDIVTFLISKGAQIDLCSLIQTEPIQIMKTLLAAGVDVNPKVDEYSKPALICAIEANKPDMIDLLLSQNNIQLDVTNECQQTPLMLALINVDLRLARKLLIELNASPFVKSNNGHDSISIGIQSKLNDLLIEYFQAKKPEIPASKLLDYIQELTLLELKEKLLDQLDHKSRSSLSELNPKYVHGIYCGMSTDTARSPSIRYFGGGVQLFARPNESELEAFMSGEISKEDIERSSNMDYFDKLLDDGGQVKSNEKTASAPVDVKERVRSKPAPLKTKSLKSSDGFTPSLLSSSLNDCRRSPAKPSFSSTLSPKDAYFNGMPYVSTLSLSENRLFNFLLDYDSIVQDAHQELKDAFSSSLRLNAQVIIAECVNPSEPSKTGQESFDYSTGINTPQVPEEWLCFVCNLVEDRLLKRLRERPRSSYMQLRSGSKQLAYSHKIN